MLTADAKYVAQQSVATAGLGVGFTICRPRPKACWLASS